jgi:hypothetical protein
MLSSSRLCNDFRLAESSREQDLSDSIVDLMTALSPVLVLS